MDCRNLYEIFIKTLEKYNAPPPPPLIIIVNMYRWKRFVYLGQ